MAESAQRKAPKQSESQARQQAEAAEAARQELANLNSDLEVRVKERTAELNAANDSLRELSARLLQLQDEERKRLARELHDSIGQSLAAMKMNNSVIAGEAENLGPRARKALEECDLMIQEVLRSIRTISYLLHPPLLDEIGLSSALRWYVSEFSQRSGIAVDLECPSSVSRLPGGMETAIFRIVQECLGNVHRHSGAAKAVIRFDVKDGTARLEVQDDGAGIPKDKLRELQSYGRLGVGLRGVRERTAQFGGELQILSSGKGVRVIATIPCKTVAADEGAA